MNLDEAKKLLWLHLLESGDIYTSRRMAQASIAITLDPRDIGDSLRQMASGGYLQSKVRGTDTRARPRHCYWVTLGCKVPAGVTVADLHKALKGSKFHRRQIA